MTLTVWDRPVYAVRGGSRSLGTWLLDEFGGSRYVRRNLSGTTETTRTP
jgi:hypothetical protein